MYRRPISCWTELQISGMYNSTSTEYVVGVVCGCGGMPYEYHDAYWSNVIIYCSTELYKWKCQDTTQRPEHQGTLCSRRTPVNSALCFGMHMTYDAWLHDSDAWCKMRYSGVLWARRSYDIVITYVCMVHTSHVPIDQWQNDVWYDSYFDTRIEIAASSFAHSTHVL